ncbi:MAG TPA: two-component regulator propeller domain-containing protein [Bryobacteraceae bacterium]|nr:two-component regulator propeller domain-containing protein [Bryobacteraceae bacterium]
MRSAIVASISFYWSFVQPSRPIGTRIEKVQDPRRHPIAVAVAAAVLAAFIAPVPGRSGPAQYVPTVWQTEQGLPQNSIEYMLQDQDGYLWLATHAGPVRFDGVNFKLFGPEDLAGLSNRWVMSLHQDRSGALWIGTHASGLIRLHNGSSSQFPVPDGISVRSIRSIREDAAGKLWINTLHAIATFVDGRLQVYQTYGGRAVSQFLLQARDQSMWFRSGTEIVRFGPDGSIATLAGGQWCREDRDGSVWIAFRDEYRLVRYSQGRFSEVPLPPITQRQWRPGYPDMIPNQEILATATDTDGALLLLTPAGLIRAANGKAGAPEPLPLPANISEAPKVSSLLVDREGNRWVGTQGGGLFRFRRAPLTAYGKDEGLSDSPFRTVFQDREGRIWMGGDSVYWFDGQRFHHVPGPAGVFGIGQLKDGDLWIGGSDGGLYRWPSGVVTRFPAGPAVHQVVEDGQGTLWVLAFEPAGHRRLYRFRGGKFELADADVQGIYENRDGGLWLVNQFRPALRYIRNGQTTLYDERNGLPQALVNIIYQDSTGTTWFAGNLGGLYRFRDGRFQAIPNSSGLTSDSINAMQDDGKGNLWFSSNRGISRVALKELNDFADGRISSLSPVSYGAAEGMKSIECNGGFPGAWRTRDGRIWFATMRGVVAVDPNAGDRLPPTVVIEEAWAGRVKLGGGGRTSVKAGSNTFDFTFTGLSLTAPEKQRFKYQLEPYDKDWVDVGTRRTAHYTNMPPGDYSFQVMAANSYGIWSVRSAGVRFALQPQFYQTNWFRSACVAAFGLLLWLAYQFRIRQLQQLFNMRLEERVQERTRIARELHDTLLQTSQAALIHMQAAYNLLARRREEAAEVLQQAINVSEAGIAEGREAIQNMRLSTVTKNDLARALGLAGDQLAAQSSASFDVRVEGSSRDVHPILRDEIYNIALEAMRNAFKHSEAHAIEARIFYGDSLRVRIRDDGKGTDPAIVTQGRSGHYGLAGMRERADRIGGKLDVCSRPGGGTEIDLSIPGAIAFGVPGAGSLFRRFRRNNKSQSAAHS